MNMKNTLSIAGIALCLVTFSGLTHAAVPSQEQQAKIHTERMQLEKAKKESLNQCNQFKEAAPDNYTRCMSEHSNRFNAEIDLLMRNPENYFARKQKIHSNTNKK